MFGLLIIALTWLASPWLGALIISIILYDYSKKKNVKKIVPKFNVEEKPIETPSSLLFYKGCTIETYKTALGEKIRIIKPNGQDLGLSFISVAEAIANIDEHI